MGASTLGGGKKKNEKGIKSKNQQAHQP